MSWQPELSVTSIVQKNVNDTIPTKPVSNSRAYDVRRDVETFKNFSISLSDIDTAIEYHLRVNLSLSVMDAGQEIKIPIIYSNPEKWKASTKDGVLRDAQGKIQLPLLTFVRESFVKNQEMMTLNRYLSYPVLSKYSSVNRYNPVSVLYKGDRRSAGDVYSITLPDHITLTYKCICQTSFVEQANSIIEKINFATEEYWGDKNKFKFRVYAGDYSFAVEHPDDGDRISKTEFPLTVQAYLLPQSFEDKKATIQRFLTPRRVKFGVELSTTAEMEKLLHVTQLRENIFLLAPNGSNWHLAMLEDGTLTAAEGGSNGVAYVDLVSAVGEHWRVSVDDDGNLLSAKIST